MKAKLTRLAFTVEVPIFNRYVLCLIGFDYQQCIEYLSAMDDSGDFLRGIIKYPVCNGLTIKREKDGNVLIWLPEMLGSVKSIATAEHERRHATDMILQHIGMPHPKGESSETHAYLQGFLAAKMWEEINKYNGYSW